MSIETAKANNASTANPSTAMTINPWPNGRELPGRVSSVATKRFFGSQSRSFWEANSALADLMRARAFARYLNAPTPTALSERRFGTTDLLFYARR